MKYDLQIGSFYNFTLYSPSIVGDDYKNAKVLGILDYDSAIVIQDIAPVHAAIYNSLPVGTPNNPKSLIYIKLQVSSGEKRVIAMDWISGTPELNTTKDITVKIIGKDLSSIPVLRQLLITNGFTNINISTE